MKKAYLILALFAFWCLASAFWYMFSVKGINAEVNPQDSLVAIMEILVMTLVSVLLGFGIAWYMREDLLQRRQHDVHALLEERTRLLEDLHAQRDRAAKAEHTLARARQTFHDDYIHISRERDLLKENQQKSHQQLSNLTDEFNLLQIELGNERQKVADLTNSLASQQQVSQKEKETSGVRYFINPFNIAATIEKSDIDDLKKIKGIGPVIEKKLNMLGIVSFKQISELSDEALDQVAHTLKFFPERIKRDNWVQQAKELTKSKSK